MTSNHLVKSVAASALLLVTFAVPAGADHHGHAVVAAVENADRPAEDKALDAARKPGDVLMFAGIAPGMKVLDINSAGGYYSELLSLTVGSEGTVYAHNGEIYWDFIKETEPARYADGRLPNVTQIHVDSETIDLPAGSLDAVIAVLAYHDYYFSQEVRGGRQEVAPVLKSIYAAMKPGGSFTIVDHMSAKGAGPDDFDKLHRIDPTVVQSQMEEAGFSFAGSSDALLNSTDDPMRSPFSKDLRRKTSRFIMKFTK